MFNVPNTINKEDEKFFRITQSVYIFCICIHFFMVFLFKYLEVPEMMNFNLFFSVPIFITSFYLNKRNYLNLAFILASTELILHQSLTIYYIGWDSGIQYYFIFAAVFMFFNYKWEFKSQIIFLIFVIFIYIMLFTFLRSDPIYKLDPFIYDIANILTMIVTTLSIAFLLNYFVKGTNRNEKELENLILKRTFELEKSQIDAISMLGEAGQYNDYNTGIHIWRMADYAALLGRYSGFTIEEEKLLKLAAPMHDTGKIGVSDYILQNPLKLNDKEWETMQSHCLLGHKILSQSDSILFQLAASIALNHHERWDGSGYPSGKKGEDIPLEARIVAIADVFDALTMKREYKEEWSTDDAFNEIKMNAGIFFDPKLVNIFLEHKDEIIRTKKYWNKRSLDI